MDPDGQTHAHIHTHERTYTEVMFLRVCLAHRKRARQQERII